MKTNKKTVSIQETDLKVTDAKDMIFGILDTQINHYKLKNLSEWVGNHNAEQDKSLEKLAGLQQTKDKLTALFSQIKSDKIAIDFSVDIELKHANISKEASHATSAVTSS